MVKKGGPIKRENNYKEGGGAFKIYGRSLITGHNTASEKIKLAYDPGHLETDCMEIFIPMG